MSILLERVQSKQAAAPQGAPIRARCAGTLSAWEIKPGQQVKQYHPVAAIDDGIGLVDVNAPHSGRVLSLEVAIGDKVQPGDVLAWVDAPEAAPTVATPPKSQPAATGEASQAPAQGVATRNPQPTTRNLATPTTGDNPQPVVATAYNARRSTMAAELELTIIEEEPAPQPVKRPKRAKIIKRTCHPTDHQVKEFDGLVERLTRGGHDYSSGELQRTMYALLLGLSERELVAALEANRDREVAGRYGYGARPQG